MTTATINEELFALRHQRLADVALAMVALQQLGFITSEGSFLSMSDGTSSVPDTRPYAFYHSQDREIALEDGRLHIAFGPAVMPEQYLPGGLIKGGLHRPGPTGQMVCDVLNRYVKAHWSGDTDERIVVLLDEEPNR
jgi:hypothetical protein